jgi:SAM-dependent methyltransferase
MRKATKLLAYTKKHGLTKTLQVVSKKIYTLKPKPLKLPNSKRYLTWFKGLSGLEIGGPSVFFEKTLSIYKVAKHIDCVNFGGKTLWQGKLEQGNNYHYYKDKTGYQYICDSVSLDTVKSGTYDFCLACNVLEHIANPFKAISEWLRVLKGDGLLFLVVPKKESNFDHNRPTTSFEHLKIDYDKNIGEDDLTHLEEILQHHDLSLDPPAGTYEEFKQRSLSNFENRALHQHVFDMDLLVRTCEFFNLEILETATLKPDYVILAKKCKDTNLDTKRH